MCGIVGIFSHAPVAAELHDSLIHLQHRGQDAAGILTCKERFYTKHGLGLVREVFTPESITKLRGNMGIAHNRYPTAGGRNIDDVQPLWIGRPRGIALAHNGNLVNYAAMAKEIIEEKHRHLNSSTDSDVLMHLLADGLDSHSTPLDAGQDFFAALARSVKNIFTKAQGSYSIVSVIIGKGMVAFRDPHGIRPLVMGERHNADGGTDYIFASETTMFYSLGFTQVADVAPGEVVFVNLEGQLFRERIEIKTFSPCIFEYVYFARPDSTLNQIGVYRARLHMGQNLAQRWREKFPDLIPDVVIPVPFTSNTAALAFAHELGVRYSEGLYKNPFIGRTFIMPNGKLRSRSVRYKLTPQKSEIQDKIVLMLDDSIVRGTTCREIIKMVKEFGAKKIYFVSACPPLIDPCFYGIDLPSREELLAANNSLTQIQEYLGVDQLLYQEKEDLIEAVNRHHEDAVPQFCTACMDGNYITGNITAEKMQSLEMERQKGRDAV